MSVNIVSQLNSRMTNSQIHSFSHCIENALCIGCGVCTVASKKIEVSMNQDGFFRANLGSQLSDEENSYALSLCPFSDSSHNEDVLADKLFLDAHSYAPIAGKHLTCNIISVSDQDLRLNSTSSGFTTWILEKLLDSGLIDGVVHVSAADPSSNRYLFKYSISTTKGEIRSSSKTRYYPVELSHVLDLVSRDDMRYAIVGLPCFIRAIQNLRFSSAFWSNKFVFSLALFCGHLKSASFTSNIINASGINYQNVASLDYRLKTPDWSAANYITSVSDGTKNSHVDIAKIPGSTWRTGGFKYFACNFCDDILGETADVSIGDAWMKPYRDDWRGHNNVIIRNKKIQSLVNEGVLHHELCAEQVSPEVSTYGAAKGGIADRRDGLSYRLYIMDVLGQLRPQKRICSSLNLSVNRRELIAIKMLNGMMTSTLYTLSRSTGIKEIFIVPVTILECWYKLVSKFNLPILLADQILRHSIRFRLFRR